MRVYGMPNSCAAHLASFLATRGISLIMKAERKSQQVTADVRNLRAAVQAKNEAENTRK